MSQNITKTGIMNGSLAETYNTNVKIFKDLNYLTSNFVPSGIYSASNWANEGCAISIVDSDIIKLAASGNGNKRAYIYHSWVSGKTYQVSFWAKTDNDTCVMNISKSIADFTPNYSLTKDWKFYSGTITPSSSGGTISIQGLTTNSVFYIWGLRIDEGTDILPWMANKNDSNASKIQFIHENAILSNNFYEI